MKKSTYIKIVISIYTIILFSNKNNAQNFNALDNIPHDISYFRESRVMPPIVKVIYGRPSLKKAKAFGEQVPFNKLWRTGANEATEVKFYLDVIFGDQLVKAGTYVLVTIPGEKEWEIILSKNTDVLGAFQYNPIFDVASIIVPVSKAEKLKTFSIGFKRIKENEISMVLAWGSTKVKIPLAFNKQQYFAKL